MAMHMDNTCLSCPNKELINACVEDFRKRGFLLTPEASLSEFLGIKCEWIENKHTH